MIEVLNVTKRFREGSGYLTVLNDLSFTINEGDKVAIMGASGSGKTTLLQILGGLDIPSAGSVIIDRAPLNLHKGRELARFRNKYLGYVFQFHHLLSDFSAIENVIIPGLIAGMKKGDALKRAAQMLADVGLSHRLNHNQGTLSGGERQRVALARALFNKPALVLADEPTGNLDKENTEHFLEIIDTLNKKNKQTFLIATHDDAVASEMDYTLILEDGKILKRG